MARIWMWLAAGAVLTAALYLLWANGWLTASRKRAAFFAELPGGRNRCGARFSSCTGYTKKAVRFRESRVYVFTLHSDIQRGTVAAELRDCRGKPLLRLDERAPKGTAAVERGGRYCWVFRFEQADGAYALTWG